MANQLTSKDLSRLCENIGRSRLALRQPRHGERLYAVKQYLESRTGRKKPTSKSFPST